MSKNPEVTHSTLLPSPIAPENEAQCPSLARVPQRFDPLRSIPRWPKLKFAEAIKKINESWILGLSCCNSTKISSGNSWEISWSQSWVMFLCYTCSLWSLGLQKLNPSRSLHKRTLEAKVQQAQRDLPWIAVTAEPQGLEKIQYEGVLSATKAPSHSHQTDFC